MAMSEGHLGPTDHEPSRQPDVHQALFDYRLFFLGADGHFRHAMILTCASDRAAIRLAASYHDGRAMELWLRDRLVKQFERRSIESNSKASQSVGGH